MIPQLMPLWWDVSLLMVFLVVVSLVSLYDMVSYLFFMVEGKVVGLEEIKWYW